MAMENTDRIVLTSDGLKNALKKSDINESIVQYVWNGFDACADTIEVNTQKNELGGVTNILIIDNGQGIDRRTLDQTFKPPFESEKRLKKGSRIDINVKGKRGVGRFSFFDIASKIEWQTTYLTDVGNKSYIISMDASDLIKYDKSEETDTKNQTGTKVVLFPYCDVNICEVEAYLKVEFAWYLQIYRNKKILINGSKLDCSDLCLICETQKGKVGDYVYEIEACIWSQKLNSEYSKYYFLNDACEVMHKENTTLNNKSDGFYHSATIRSSLFDKFDFKTSLPMDVSMGFKSKRCDEYVEIRARADEFLYNIRKPFLKEHAQEFINKLKSKDVYPFYNKNNPIEQLKEKQLDETVANIYYFEPRILTNLSKTQNKTLLRMLELIMSSGETENLFKIISEVVVLTKEERAELAILLDKTTLSNIIAMQKLVVDRLQAIQDLKVLIFSKDNYVNEIDHIQKAVEAHYWIFGEQYHLVTAEEPNFEEALRRYIHILRGEEHEKGSIKIEHEHAKKQMDIFAVQQLLTGEIKRSIVVELKRPNLIIKRKELNQIKNYFSVIMKDERFNANNIEWIFYLVGNDYNEEIEQEIESNKQHGERSLAFKVNKCKIYVKKWSEIFTDLELSFNFLNEKLKLNYKKLIDNKDKNSDKLVSELLVNNAASKHNQL